MYCTWNIEQPKKDSKDAITHCIQRHKLWSYFWIKRNQLTDTNRWRQRWWRWWWIKSRKQHVVSYLFVVYLDKKFLFVCVFLDGLTLGSNFYLKLKSSSHLRNEMSIAHTAIIRTLYLVVLLAIILENTNIFGSKAFNKRRKRGI